MNAMTNSPVLPHGMGEALADELVALSCQLGDLAYDLGSQPETLRHHMKSLQSIDRITQAQLAIADMLRSQGSIEERLGGITLEALAASLRARLDASGEGASGTDT